MPVSPSRPVSPSLGSKVRLSRTNSPAVLRQAACGALVFDFDGKKDLHDIDVLHISSCFEKKERSTSWSLTQDYLFEALVLFTLLDEARRILVSVCDPKYPEVLLEISRHHLAVATKIT